ncbi:MAG: hypothetical protein M3404_01885 [Actinomycetota bacterium]|nr:hypothetical protein [Actinomycetota bacterium]
MVKAGPLAAWLFVCGLTYCSRYLTDGRIPKEQVGRLSDIPKVQAHVARLLEVGLWHDFTDHYQVHDYEDWQEPAARVLEKRKAAKERRSSGTKPPPSRERNANVARTSSESHATFSPKDQQTSKPAEEQPPPNPPGGDVSELFEHWRRAAGKNAQTVLDAKRRKRLAWALSAFPFADVADALVGWQKSPFHCGENDRGTTFNDITLLLRDAEHLERFRDLQRGVQVATNGRRSTNVERSFRNILETPEAPDAAQADRDDPGRDDRLLAAARVDETGGAGVAADLGQPRLRSLPVGRADAS